MKSASDYFVMHSIEPNPELMLNSTLSVLLYERLILIAIERGVNDRSQNFWVYAKISLPIAIRLPAKNYVQNALRCHRRSPFNELNQTTTRAQ